MNERADIFYSPRLGPSAVAMRAVSPSALLSESSTLPGRRRWREQPYTPVIWRCSPRRLWELVNSKQEGEERTAEQPKLMISFERSAWLGVLPWLVPTHEKHRYTIKNMHDFARIQLDSRDDNVGRIFARMDSQIRVEILTLHNLSESIEKWKLDFFPFWGKQHP